VVYFLDNDRILFGVPDNDDHAAEGRSRMKVREFLALLKNADPDVLIVIAADSLLIVNPRPDCCLPHGNGRRRILALDRAGQAVPARSPH